MPSLSRSRKIFGLATGGVLLLAVLIAYIPAMQGGFIWDDDFYVTENKTLRTTEGLSTPRSRTGPT